MVRSAIFLAFLTLFLTSSWARQPTDFGRFHALVIGNNNYLHLTKLKTPINDAEAVAKVLKDKYGFKVIPLKDATRDDILKVLNQLRGRLTEKDNLLIYYAGHGTLDRDTQRGYWQPIDAEENDNTHWIPTTDITDFLNKINAKHVMVVADSCYSGTLLRSTNPSEIRIGEEGTAWVHRMAMLPARTALTSGWLQPVQDNGNGDHSVFASVLLDILQSNEEILDGHHLFELLKRRVSVRATGSEQTPKYGDIPNSKYQGGDFLLVPEKLQAIEINNMPKGSLPVWLRDKETSGRLLLEPIEPRSDKSFQAIANRFLMDNMPERIINVIPQLQGGTSYKIFEYTSPWKWEGTATLEGNNFIGQAYFLEDETPMRIEGILRTDGTIKIDYIFLTRERKPTGRVDKHVWVPAK